jgi:hypothetical protein
MNQQVTAFLDGMQEQMDGYGRDYRYPGWNQIWEDMPKARAGNAEAVKRMASFAEFAMATSVARLGQEAVQSLEQ